MPKRRYPEQRSTTSAQEPGQGPAKPTGDEVFQPAAAQQQGPPEEEFTEEELEELDELRRSAAEAYHLLSDATSEVSARIVDAYDASRAFIRDNPLSTVAGAFAVGIVLGLLSSDE